MAEPVRRRDEQRAATEAAILDAASALVAQVGPSATSMRDVARRAGCTHSLVAKHFGSKAALVAAVADDLAARIAGAADQAWATATDPIAELLSVARTNRPCTQLLVRCGLGDLRPGDFPACLRIERIVTTTVGLAGSGPGRIDRRARLCSYAAASLLLGWLTFEGFVVAASRLGAASAERRDRAVADAAHRIMRMAGSPEPRFARPSPPAPLGGPSTPGPPVGAREALLSSAVELFASLGPAAVSVRDVARHAAVNHGLVHRHFGSKDALLAEAIERGSEPLFPAAFAATGFDVETVVALMHHHSPAPRLIARTLVDDIDIDVVRSRFPVVRQLLDSYEGVPTGTRPGDLTDPRVAVAAAAAMSLGSVVWGPHVREAIGLSDHDGAEAAVAAVARVLLAQPRRPSG